MCWKYKIIKLQMFDSLPVKKAKKRMKNSKFEHHAFF